MLETKTKSFEIFFKHHYCRKREHNTKDWEL